MKKVLVVKVPKVKIDLLSDGFITAIVLTSRSMKSLTKNMIVFLCKEDTNQVSIKAKIQDIKLLTKPSEITPLQILTTQETKKALAKKITASKNGILCIYLKDVKEKKERLINLINASEEKISKYAIATLKKSSKESKMLDSDYGLFYEKVCANCKRNNQCPYHKYNTICDKKIVAQLDLMSNCRRVIRRVSSCENCLRYGWCKYFTTLEILFYRKDAKWKSGQLSKNAKPTK